MTHLVGPLSLPGVTAGKENPLRPVAEHSGLTLHLQPQAHLPDEPQASRCHRLPCPGLEVICQCLSLLLLLQTLSQRETWELPEPSQET